MHYAQTSLVMVVFAGAVALAEEAPVLPVRITVHSIQMIRSQEALSERCGSKALIRGCTRFFGRQFSGDCKLDGEAWRIEPQASFAVKTFVAILSSMGHEFAHIRDVENDVTAFTSRISSHRFDSKDDCQTAVREAAAGFAAEMDVMQGNSNVFRHPHLRKPETVTTRVE